MLYGTSFRLTASATASAHSAPRTAVAPPCIADSADAHAVSTLEHGPCRPSTNESRPAAADTLSPVTAYTDARADGGCAIAQSGRSMPRNTPLLLPISRLRRRADACRAAYPSSSKSRCCGSIAPTSATETPNSRLSKRSAPLTKPPCFTHCSCTSLSEESARSSITSSSTHRADGTLLIASPHACCNCSRASQLFTPPGQRPTSPSTPSCRPSSIRTTVAGAATTTPSTAAICSTKRLVIARGDGRSNTIVGEIGTPVNERRREANSVAANESTPASIRGVSLSSDVAGRSLSSRTIRNTAACTYSKRAASVSGASVFASGLAAAACAASHSAAHPHSSFSSCATAMRPASTSTCAPSSEKRG